MNSQDDLRATDAALSQEKRLVEHVQMNSELENFRARLALELHALELREAEIRKVLKEFHKKIKRLRTLLGVSQARVTYSTEDRVMVLYKALEENGAMSLAQACKAVEKVMGPKYSNPIAVNKLLARHDGLFVKVERGIYAVAPRLLELNKARREASELAASSRVMLTKTNEKENDNASASCEP